MESVEEFLTAKEEKEIVQAIAKAEQFSSGEIRVHIENKSPKNHEKRIQEVFHYLKMQETKDRNGVLLYISITEKYFHIHGDEGINKVVPANFWNSVRDIIQNNFKVGKFKGGIIQGILEIGKQLSTFFPYDKDNDINELSNEISKG